MQLAIDTDEYLVEMPGVTRPRPSPAQLASKLGSEFSAPMPNALVGHDRAPLGQDQLDISQAEAEHVVEPHGMADDLGWKPVTGI